MVEKKGGGSYRDIIEFEESPGVFRRAGAAYPLPVNITNSLSVSADLSDVEAYTSRLLSVATPVAPGAASSSIAFNIGGRYNATQKTLTDGQEASWAMSSRGAMMVTPGAESFGVNVASKAYSVAVPVTRPSNQTPYTAGDTVGATAAAMQFTGVGAGAGEYLVTAVSLRFDAILFPAGMTGFILHLYNATPASAPVDNAPFGMIAGDAPLYLGMVTIPTPVEYGTGDPATSFLYIEADGLAKQVKLTTANMFGVLQTISGWTPDVDDTHMVTVHTRAA